MNQEPFKSVMYTIQLKQKNGEYRWQRNDGEWVSPTFTTREAAQYAANKIPLITDEEWKLYYPIKE